MKTASQHHLARRRYLPFFCLVVSFASTARASSPQVEQDQHLLKPTTSVQDSLSHLSSLFLAASAWTPSEATPSTTAPCCGTTCAPQQCNIHLPAYDSITDVAWLYATPSTQSSTTTDASSATPVSFPCCHPNCPDGACRLSPGISSQRPPPSGAKITPGPVPPGFRQPEAAGDEPAGIGYGCCLGCRLCRHSGREPPGGEETMLVATSTEAFEEAARAMRPRQGGDGVGDNGDEARAKSCVGCVGGRCYPCRGEKVVEVLAMQVRDLLGFTGDGGEGEKRILGGVVDAVKKFVVGGRDLKHAHPQGDSELVDQPVFLLGRDFVDGINGVNQDIVPVVVEGFAGTGVDNIVVVADGQKFELLTLLATVDMKVQENYISSRIVRALGRDAEVRSLEGGAQHRQAVLNSALDTVQIKGSLEMGIVIGSLTGDGAVQQRLLKGVNWNVFDDGGLYNVPGVSLGTKLLNEIGGLQLVNGVRRSAAADFRAVGIGHAIPPPVAHSVERKIGKDEL